MSEKNDLTLPAVADAEVDPRLSYNRMFERLVIDLDDLPGLVAYGIYKHEKRAWLREQSQKGNVVSPTDEHRYSEHFSDGEIDRLRSQAESALIAFAESIVADKAPDIRENAIRDIVADHNSRVITAIATNTSTWKSVVANVYAWLIIAGALAALTLFVYLVPSADDWFKAAFSKFKT